MYVYTYVPTVEDRGTKRVRNARYAPGIASIFERDLSLHW